MTKTQPKIERTKDGLFVVRLRQVPVNHDRTFEEAIRAGAPNTPSNYAIWQAASQYPKAEGKSGVELTDISLLGYGRNWESQEAVDYVITRNLPAASFRQVLAIGEVHPQLHKDLGKDYLAAVSLQKCKLGGFVLLPYLWFVGDERGRCLQVRRRVERRLLVRGSRRGILGLWALESIWLFWAFGFLGLLRLVPPPLSGSASKQILSGKCLGAGLLYLGN